MQHFNKILLKAARTHPYACMSNQSISITNQRDPPSPLPVLALEMQVQPLLSSPTDLPIRLHNSIIINNKNFNLHPTRQDHP